MIYDFDHPPERRGTDSVKWKFYPPEVLPLWVADMDFPAAEPVVRTLQARVAHGIYGYPLITRPQTDHAQLRQVLVERMQSRYTWQVTPEQLLFLPGVVLAMNLACHTLAEAGGEILVNTPIYPHFLETGEYSGMTLKDVQLSRQADGSYVIDWEAFEAAFTPRTRLFLLCNPHNPVGRVFRRDELERMADICLQRGVVICSDEIHCDLLFSGQKHIPMASLNPEVARNTITLMAPTKTFNMPGLQCAFAIVQNPELYQKMLHSTKGLVMWVNLMGITAAEAAYREGGEWLEQLLTYLERNRDVTAEFVRSELPAVRMARPEGTYLAWLDCREAGIDGNPYEFFLKRARVALNPGPTFGAGGEGFVRLNFACPQSTLLEGLGRMKAALQKLHA